MHWTVARTPRCCSRYLTLACNTPEEQRFRDAACGICSPPILGYSNPIWGGNLWLNSSGAFTLQQVATAFFSSIFLLHAATRML
jgi:hypothetical protein